MFVVPEPLQRWSGSPVTRESSKRLQKKWTRCRTGHCYLGQLGCLGSTGMHWDSMGASTKAPVGHRNQVCKDLKKGPERIAR